MEALDISGSGSYEGEEGSLGLKSQFVNSLSITTYCISIAVYTNIVTSDFAYNNVGLTSAVTAPTAATLDTFFQAYGDSFVSQLVEGAEYMAVYVFYAQSAEDQMNIKAALTAKGITEGGVITADLQSSFEDVTKSVQISWMLKQCITGISNPTYPGGDGIISYAMSFGTLTADNPTILSYQTMGYEHVPGITTFQPIADTRDVFLGTGGQSGLVTLAQQLTQIRNQISFITSVYQTYGYSSDSNFSTLAAVVAEDWITLSAEITNINNDPTQSYQVPSLPSLSNGSPALTFILSYAGPWGSATGTAFQDVSAVSVAQQTTITSILLRGDKCVDNMSVTYSSPSAPGETIAHGGNGGSLDNPINLQQGEFITNIAGIADPSAQVLQLSFTTSKQGPITWPTSPWQGSLFAYNVPNGQVIIGFQGFADGYLEQLQPVLCQFSPATWQ